jgi:soluble lytic murein transglycosylase-like protein
MFIPETARAYGLAVDPEGVDQRFDAELETAAAVALLTDLHSQFGDWDLALAAYNQGPLVVQDAIERGASRDVGVLVEKGLLNGYVPEVHAAALILAQPSLVD